MDRTFTVNADALDAATTPSVDTVLQAFAAGGGDVVIDLTHVEFMDSSGIGLLVRARNTVENAGGTLRLSGLAPLAQRTLDITGMSRVIPTIEA